MIRAIAKLLIVIIIILIFRLMMIGQYKVWLVEWSEGRQRRSRLYEDDFIIQVVQILMITITKYRVERRNKRQNNI